VLADLVRQAIAGAGLPADAVQLIPTTDRAALNSLLKLDAYVHCIIPRGGEGLIRFVAANSTIPVIKHYTGVCFVYVDRAADAAMAERILLNAKIQRPGVCNAAEQLLVHAEAAEKLLPRLGAALAAGGRGAPLRRGERRDLARAGVAERAARPADFTAEFLDLILAVRVVGFAGRGHRDHQSRRFRAQRRHRHDDESAARRFLAGVDSAAVFWNASTRFHDGFEFGYGAEIGISTDRLHARGPMGLRELCSHKFLVVGTGQVRG
jgi:glutamate-5-semialdehyde dehydrogenase